MILKILHKNGFLFVRQKGSHARFRKVNGPVKKVTIKMSKKKSLRHFSVNFTPIRIG
ncbi:type II toxin-antitoxin system HicA family toxin [Patescibacteria group bacterium]|nr:type II toxin-antitoxin system HicA family toxin [Patescibacteria group bacterium]